MSQEVHVNRLKARNLYSKRRLSVKMSSPERSKTSALKTRVRIEGEGRDEWKKRYFKFSVDGSTHDIPPVPAEQLVKETTPLFEALANAGSNAFTKKARNEVLEKLQRRKPQPPVFKVATRLGWNSGAYVLPDQTVGNPKVMLEKAFNGLDRAMLDKYRVRGSLTDWQDQIAAPCKGNSRLMFSVCLAFTGPILRFVNGPKAGGFQIWGDAETGKTTAAMVAGSVWGCHRSEGRREKGFAESWNSTAGKVEVTALAHNDALLILDETKRAGNNDRERAEIVTRVSFGLAEMTEKERLTNPGSVRSWRCFFLSTSNLSLAQLGRQGKIQIDEAHRGRMADIPLPRHGNGLDERLNGLADGEELSDVLQRRSRRYYGTPAREFIRNLVRDCEAARALKKFLNRERRAYRKVLTASAEAEGLKPLGRSSGRYATVFAAGSLASDYEIVPWTRKRILKAVLSCELDQLRQADHDEDVAAGPSPESLRAKVVQHLTDHHAEFMYLNKQRPQYGSDAIDAVPGYRAKVKGQRWYYLTADQLKGIIGTGMNANALKQVLASEGLLDHKKKKFLVQRRIFRGGKGNQNFAWVHAIKADILDK
jgi:hypothetical protein